MTIWKDFSVFENKFLSDVCEKYFDVSINNFSKDTGTESHIFYYDDTENTYNRYYIWYTYSTTILRHIDDNIDIEDIYIIDNITGHSEHIQKRIP